MKNAEPDKKKIDVRFCNGLLATHGVTLEDIKDLQFCGGDGG